MAKKLLSVIMALCMMIFAGCGNTEPKDAAQVETPANKTLVAYFSCTGKTKKAADEVATILGADTFEIVPAKPYTPADLDYNIETSRALVEQKNPDVRPAISNKIENIAQYKTIVIAYPIWKGYEPRIIDTFIESYDFKGKTIVPICTSGGSEITASVKSLKSLCAGANFKDGKRLGVISTDEVKAWLESLNL